MAWHLNSDKPIRTRNPQPRGWGRAITSTRWVFALPDQVRRSCSAIHEAAHAAMYLRAGVAVEWISVDPVTNPSRGSSGPATKTLHRRLPFKELAVALAAGERAADRWLRETGRWTPERAWAIERNAWFDRDDVETAARHYGQALTYGERLGDPCDYATICDLADLELDEVWPGVLKLAAEAAGKGRVAGDRIIDILQSVTGSDSSPA